MNTLYANKTQGGPYNKRKTTKILNSDDDLWRFSYLKRKIREIDKLDEKFQAYIVNIRHAYLTLFMFLQVFLSTTQIVLVIIYCIKMNNDIFDTIPDLVFYSITAIITVVGMIVTESFLKKHPQVKILKIISTAAFIIICTLNIVLLIYHHFKRQESMLPFFGTHLVLSCYVFLTWPSGLMAIVSASIVTCGDLLILYFITYNGYTSEKRWVMLVSDIIYYVCINILGFYFRHVYEFVERKGFLDRRACVENNLELIFMKDQEEQLLLSILPNNFIEEFKKDIITHKNKIMKPRPFENRFLVNYENVTILYADIVNYTFMTTQLTPVSKLVETLNDLFGSFDRVSEELKVLRIKFLGDCYYCVGGLPPDSIKNHADACVDVGLKMIKIIKRVRENRQLDVDMRIGIHTGSIIGGIIGMCKWQFDIWSKDVSIANRMETTGTPGKVHITRQTKDQLEKLYKIEPTDVGLKDAMLRENKIETFLISPEHDLKYKRPNGASSDAVLPKPNGIFNLERRFSGKPSLEKRSSDILKDKSIAIANSILEADCRPSVGDIKRRTAFMENNITRYQERLKNIDKELMNVIDTMPVTKKDQWCVQKEIHPFFLTYKKFDKEVRYIRQADPLFKYYLVPSVVVLIGMILISGALDLQWSLAVCMQILTLSAIIFGLLPLSWMRFFYDTYRIRKTKISRRNSDEDHDEEFIKYFDDMSVTTKNHEPKSKLIFVFYKAAQVIANNYLTRLFIYIFISGMVVLSFFLSVFNCDYIFEPSTTKTTNSNCLPPWQMTKLCGLSILLNFVFFRIHLWLKWIFFLTISSLYTYFILLNYDSFLQSETYNYFLPAPISHILYILHLTITLHVINRQTDYLNRLDFNWNLQLILEEEEASVKREINYCLLKNILPMHVVELYLNLNREKELYYREYERVAVMFASIVNYDKGELGPKILLQLMDQMISDFDEILLGESEIGENIEKIKVINWTYMAAAGLNPNEKFRFQQDKLHSCSTTTTTTTFENNDTCSKYLIQIVNFAIKMMKALEKIRRETKQDCDIRVGICYGEVIAGVVGSRKPLYDIWGDTVNMASRMDSTGEPGKIQVTQDTATVLERSGIQCVFRDFIFVKGKSEKVPTYFVSLDDKENL